MVPWAGRIAGGRIEWEGRTYRLRRNHGDHSIHGVAFDIPWEVSSVEDRSAELVTSQLPGWPFPASAQHAAVLRPGRLELTLAVEALASPMPAWIGWHPWFRRPEEGDMTMRVEGGDVLETDPDLIPTGRRLGVGGATDLRAAPALGDRRLDHVYPDARTPAEIAWPDLTLAMDFALPYRTLVVHTPEAGVCVEPQTAWPDAIALEGRGVAAGLTRLEPGTILRAMTTWTWSKGFFG